MSAQALKNKKKRDAKKAKESAEVWLIFNVQYD